MNFSQITGILRIVLPAAISFAVGKGWVTQDAVTQAGGVLAAVVAAGGWSAVSNSTLNLSKTVAAVPGLTVVVDHTAPPEVRVAAADRVDPAVKDIVPAESVSLTQRK